MSHNFGLTYPKRESNVHILMLWVQGWCYMYMWVAMWHEGGKHKVCGILDTGYLALSA